MDDPSPRLLCYRPGMTRREDDGSAERDLAPDAPFGERLRVLRLAANLSQEALAAAAGVSARTISDLERGVRTTPQSQPATLIADALGLAGGARERYFAAIRQQRLPRGNAAVRITPDLPDAGPILGREAEIALIGERLAGGDRLVSLIGPGGVGKTRLALEVAARRDAAAPGSVVWLALDLVAAPAGVLPSIARACGVRDRGSGNLPGRIAEAIAGRDVPLVIDNAEHVLEALSLLPDLLARAPRAAVLLTSREEARLAGERIVRVEPLPLPRRGATGAALAANPAVALYIDRLGAGAGVGAGEAAAVDEAAAVVRLLDGLPLAIELAAAQAIALPRLVLPALLEATGLAALARGRRDGPGRFRTMEAAITWSVDLLPPGADRLLRLLGVFRGGFTAAAVAGIATGARWPEAVGSLAALANAQLVAPDSASGAPRFRLLEPVRMYALDRLRAGGEEARAAEAHARWFLGWARGQAVAIDGPDPVPALDAVERDLPNLLAALSWASANGDPVAAMETLGALRRFFDFRGYIGEFRAQLDAAIAAAGSALPAARPLMDALFWSAIFANMQGDAAASGSRIDRLRALAAESGSVEHAVLADIAGWGRAGASADTRNAAGAYLRNALETLGEHAAGDLSWMLALLLGVELHESGDPAGAIAPLERAAAAAAARACALDRPLPLARLGLALLDLGREEEARVRLDESLALSARLDAEVIALFALLGLARLDARPGSPDAARLAARRLGAAEAIVARLGLSWGPYWEGVLDDLRARLAAALGPEPLAARLAEGAAAPLSGVLAPS
ncbi:MAG: ATP-binding protein [Chloroflexota bacterium]